MPYVTVKEAAAHYGLCEKSVRNKCASGEFKGRQLGGAGCKWQVWIPDEKKRAAQSLDSDATRDEVLTSSTLGGHFTWKN